MKHEQISNIKEYLRENLAPKKVQHSLDVAETAKELAILFGENEEDAYIAGLVHDIARDIDSKRLLEIAQKKKLLQHPIEEMLPVVLHASVGAYLAEHELGIKKRAILDAVKKHTVAAPYMSPLDRIIYLADVIEPARDYDGVNELRELARKDLNLAFLKALEGTIMYLIKRRIAIHPFTIEARNNLLLKEWLPS